MESQDKEKQYKHNVWEIYRREWATASEEKRVELNKRMFRWQELMKNGWTASQAYYRAMQEESDYRVVEEGSDKPPRYSLWSWMRKVPSVVLILALVAAIVYCVVITRDRDALNTELASVENTLALTQSELSSTTQTLTSTRGELSSTKQTLASTQAELSSTEQALISTESELSSTKQTLTSTKQTLASTQSDLSSTKQTLASVQTELGTTRTELLTVKEKLKLYQDTLGVEVFPDMQDKIVKGGSLFPREYVKLTDNPDATNTTWSKLMTFLYADPTDDEYYNVLNFNCTNFAERLHNNAEAKGIRAAFVAVHFANDPKGHALNAFKTTNRGLVYVDCTGGDFGTRLKEQLYGYTTECDSVAYVWKGEGYCRWSIDKYTFGGYRYYEPYRQTSDWERYGIVESIKIYW